MTDQLFTLPLSNSLAALPEAFYSRVAPTPFESTPRLIHFNAQAATLLGLDPEIATEKLHRYGERYAQHHLSRMRAKLGLAQEQADDAELTETLLGRMAKDGVDFTIAFRQLCDFSSDAEQAAIRDLFIDREAFDAWAARYRERLQQENSDHATRQARMRRVNPKYVLRNCLAETAIRKAEDQGDYSEIERLMTLLQAPFDEHPEQAHYADHPPAWASRVAVSCSS